MLQIRTFHNGSTKHQISQNLLFSVLCACVCLCMCVCAPTAAPVMLFFGNTSQVKQLALSVYLYISCTIFVPKQLFPRVCSADQFCFFCFFTPCVFKSNVCFSDSASVQLRFAEYFCFFISLFWVFQKYLANRRI